MSTESKKCDDISECKIHDDNNNNNNKTINSILHDISNFRNLSDKTLHQINTKMSSKYRLLVLKRFNDVVNYARVMIEDSSIMSTK